MKKADCRSYPKLLREYLMCAHTIDVSMQTHI